MYYRCPVCNGKGKVESEFPIKHLLTNRFAKFHFINLCLEEIFINFKRIHNNRTKC